MNSTASSPVDMPPMPSTGTETALGTCHTMRRATGFTAGPNSRPPRAPASGGGCAASIGHAEQRVDERDARRLRRPRRRVAISVISVTFGVSFTMSGRFVAARQSDTTFSTLGHMAAHGHAAGVHVRARDVHLVGGHRGLPPSASMTATYSSKLWPETFTMAVAPISASHGSSMSFKCCTPGF